jgi:hypothetical protein
VKPELRRVGNEQSPVVIIDEFSGDAERIARIADAMGPLPGSRTSYYPGARRFITQSDVDAWDYVKAACERIAPFLGGGFGLGGFYLLESSFSMVSTPPRQLLPQQRAPHFDSPDQKYLALLHYLRVPEGTGTAFYRHRATGIERVTDKNVDMFVHAAKADAAKLAPDAGYIQGSDEFYEQIGVIEAVPDRLVIYQGSLLHSGIIPPNMPLTTDPREGRLTANIFVQGR